MSNNVQEQPQKCDSKQSIKAETINERLSEIALLTKVLKWVSKEDNVDEALKKYCKQYSLDYDAVHVILKTSLRCPVALEDEAVDTLTLVEAELDSSLMLDRRQLARKSQYIEALHKAIKCLSGDTLTFATLRYIEVNSLKDIEKSMGITRADSAEYIRTISRKLVSVRQIIKYIFKNLGELADLEKRISDEETSIMNYENGAKLSEWQLKRYHTVDNVIAKSREYIAQMQDTYKKDLLEDIEHSVRNIREAFDKGETVMVDTKEINANTPIKSIVMSTRLKNVLLRKPIETLSELSEYSRKQIMSFNSMGEKLCEELELLMNQVGLKLKEDQK